LSIDDVLAFVSQADAKAVRKISQALAARQARLASGKITTASVYREVPDHPTNKPPQRPLEDARED
jgi:hypothetical protein